ncbi:hypothetical protein EK21DRAFT_118842 [Setomelanomma holmii]|uniref:F-box domain-containing protein n=1 Tax=Setomelanomma holmii TaxID=210430 RepID=A0A9P4GUY5_9PLEO|nr:hypothetical protein EK21DRAFT_118842 [Setomelanomma holmii]
MDAGQQVHCKVGSMEFPVALKRMTLLDLPGEIRNRIYDAAVGGENTQCKLSPPEAANANPDDETSSGDPEKRQLYAFLDRAWLGLTQTCRQLRIEFLPIYFANLDIMIDYWNVYDYLATFIFQGKLNEDPTTKEYTLSLSSSHNEISPSINIAPLLRTYKKSPGFKLNFGEDHRYSYDVQCVLNRDNTAWWEYMLKAISRIHYHANLSFSYMDTLVKPEFAEGWMSSGYSDLIFTAYILENYEECDAEVNRRRDNYQEYCKAWAESFGFDDMEEEFVVVVDPGDCSNEGQWLEKFLLD